MNNYNQQFYQDVLTGPITRQNNRDSLPPAVDRKQIQKGYVVMNLKELYACCGGDFDTVMDIWRSDERVARFLGRFLEDSSYANFHKFLEPGKLPEAFEDFSRAIELNPLFAEAFYNRGMTQIYMKDTRKGCLDLSKAGELGITSAYEILKRYTGEHTEAF